jgi:glycosyltransferase involved in cell wall biosynthesis
MRIAIDARMYGLEHAGIGRYIINLIDQIEKLDKQNDYFILLRKRYFLSLKFKSLKFKKILADYPHYSLCEQTLLPLQLIKLHPDVVHFPSFNIPLLYFGRKITTIHDLIKHRSRGPETTTRCPLIYWFKYLIYLLVSKWVVISSAKIIVPSAWTKKELIKQYHLSSEKIVVTYEGIDKNFQFSILNSQFKKVLEKYKIRKPFVVYTGSLYPHKNIKRLIEAVKLLKLSLVVVCARSVFFDRLRQQVEQAGAERYVNLAGFVPDEELAVLYGQAEAFVFPSLIEGFGLPGLEAMATGLPVVASDSSCLPEIYGEAAIYFDPYNVNDMADKIREVTSNQLTRNRLIKLGYKQVAKYSWQKMVQQTLEIYASCFSL